MKKQHKFTALLLGLSLFFSACGNTQQEETLSEEDIILTFSVGTMVADFFATQTAMVTPTAASTNTPLPTNTFLPPPTVANTQLPLPTWTFAPVFPTGVSNIALTPTVTGTPPTATPNTGALAFGCNNAALVRDANYPSGTTVSPGEDFTKTWKVQNTGTCDWQYNYTMAIVVDNDFDSSWGRLGRDVKPGDWAEVSVSLSAPNNDGVYTGSWRMADSGGNPFGATLSVTIIVP